MDWDTATSIHLSNPPGRIITIGGFDIEMGTLTEFREVRGANTRLSKKGRRWQQQQQFVDCRAGLKKKESLEMAEGREGGRRKRVCKKSGRGRRQGGEGGMGEEAEDSPMTLF